MISASNLLSLALLYVCLLFLVAWYADRSVIKRQFFRRKPRLNGVLYALTLAVYCSSWTFYGAVGSATESAWSHAPIYLGPILVFVFGWPFIRRLLEVGARHRVTSIADLIGARFGKRQSLAVIVVLVAAAAVLPYIALQFKALAQAWTIVGGSVEEVEAIGADAALLTAITLAVFTILFGTRRLDGRERHQGVMAAIAVESVVKLMAFVAVAVLALIYLMGVPTSETEVPRSQALGEFSLSSEFLARTLISAMAIICLPRQFHVMVVEAPHKADTAIARWLFPMYLMLFMLLVVPISLAGSEIFAVSSSINPDTYVQLLPIALESNVVTVAAFIGGISAATGMVIVATVSLAIMITNEIIVPLYMRLYVNSPAAVLRLGDSLRRIRQVTIAMILLAAWLATRKLMDIPWLTQIGFISFLAAAQMAPALIAGLYWRKARGSAVTAGLLAGVGLWFYCGLLPVVVPEQSALLSQGPFGLEWLRPLGLLGIDGESRLAYATAWSLGVNAALLVVISLLLGPSRSDRRAAALFVDSRADDSDGNSDFELSLIRVNQLQVLMQPFIDEAQLQNLWRDFEEANQQRLLPGDRAPQFVVDRLESMLASIIGASSAHRAMMQLERSRQLAYADLAEMVNDASKLHTFNREFLQSTVENLAQGISVVDGELRLVAWNSRYEELFGYPRRFLYVGCPIERVYRFNAERGIIGAGGRSIEEETERRLHWLREGNPHRLERTLPNGKVIDIRGNPLPHGGFVTTYTDITDYREVVEQLDEAQIELRAQVASGSETLSQANAQLRSENRLRAEVEAQLREAHLSKSRFMSASSHDLLQPINAARLFSSALGTRLGEDAGKEISQLVQQIDGSLRRAEQLIAELREVARLDSGHQTPKLEHFSVRDTFDNLRQEFQGMAEESQLQLRVHAADLWLHSDKALLYRSLQNLVANALLYTTQGGVLLSARRRDGKVLLQVWDTGSGIAEADQAKIFNEFERGPQQGAETDKGLGLGLSIVERIASLLEMPLTLDSRDQRGSCFSLIVPRGIPQQRNTRSEVEAGDLAGISLLCLDNDPMILSGLEQALLSKGAVVRVCSDRSGLGELLQDGTRPDAILADYQLDEGDNGIDAVSEELKQRSLHIPCIVISADDAPAIRQRARDAGFRFLPKPVNAARLRALVLALNKDNA